MYEKITVPSEGSSIIFENGVPIACDTLDSLLNFWRDISPPLTSLFI